MFFPTYRHLADRLFLVGEEQSAQPHPSGGRSGLASRVPPAYHDDVVGRGGGAVWTKFSLKRTMNLVL